MRVAWLLRVYPPVKSGRVPAHFISTTEDYAKKTRHDMLELDLDNFRKNKKDELLRVLK